MAGKPQEDKGLDARLTESVGFEQTGEIHLPDIVAVADYIRNHGFNERRQMPDCPV
jgi:hypothetical protein